MFSPSWRTDLKHGVGSLVKGEDAKPDLRLTVTDDDMVALANGKLNAQQVGYFKRGVLFLPHLYWFPQLRHISQAFMRGKLKLKGNMGLAMKLQTVLAAAKSAASNPRL